MDQMPQLTVTPILRQAAELKIDELNHAKDVFKLRYRLDVRRSAETNTFTRVKALIEDVKKFNSDILDNGNDLVNLDTYLGIAEDDWSFSESKMLRFEEKICSKLHKYLNRLEVSTLHVELMRNAMDVGDPTTSTATKVASIDLDDFDVIENDFDEAFANYEKAAFSAREVDVASIEAYLTSLTDGQDFEDVRSGLRDFCEELESDGVEIDLDFLMWCIVDLLGNDLISDEKKRALQDYLQSPIALRELVSVINVKSIREWDYKNAKKGLSLSVKQRSDGQRCIILEEDIVDMLFLHSVGYKWASKLQSCLVDCFAQDDSSFEPEVLTVEQSLKRQYFLGRTPSKPDPPLMPSNICTMCHTLSPPALMPPPPPIPMGMGMGCPPPPPPVVVIDYPGKKKKSKSRPFWGPPRLYSRSNVADTRNSNYKKEFFMSRLPLSEGCTPKVTSSEDVQAKLAKTLAVESKFRQAFGGPVYSGSAHFRSLASALPHQTALAVLKFLGVPKASLSFIERFLSAKINLGPIPGAPDRVVSRARGVSEDHALELLLTEALMFFLELAVRRKTGSYLYRLNNECHFVGNHDQHEAYEAQVSSFAKVMGLEVSFDQSLSIGFLRIVPGSISINDDGVKLYAVATKKELDACSTMLNWVRVWNKRVGTYAAHLFGPPANVFGKSHLDMVRKAYRFIFDYVLQGESLTTYAKNLIVKHIGHSLPESSFSLEAFIYLPQEYGGLGVKNPFVTLNLAHEVHENPDELLSEYLVNEDAYYKRAATMYTNLPSDARARKIEALFESKDDRIAAALGQGRDLTTFMSKEELTEHREITHYPDLSSYSSVTVPPPPPPPPTLYVPNITPNLVNVYKELLEVPVDIIPYGEKVRDDVQRLRGTGDMRSWRKLAGEEQWVLQLYGDECFEKYEGLEQWVGKFVPQDILKAVRGADWDDDSDDDSSATDP